MLSTLTVPTRTSSPPSVARPHRDGLVLAGAALLAHLPLLARHAAWLWQRPHYQFFPFVLVGAVVLAYARLRNVSRWRPGRLVPTAVGVSVAWSLLAAADLFESGWLGCVSFLLLLMVVLYGAGGRAVCRDAFPAWVLLWLLVPPPLDVDRLLVLRLQNLTTAWSSSVLDVLGVIHGRTGNVIEVDGRQLLVEQACSGVNSLYSLISCTLFVVFLTGRGWVRGVVLLAAAISLVLAVNVARVTGIAYLNTLGLDLTTGWKHEAVGIVLFVAAVGLLLSTDQLFTFLTRSALPSREGLATPPVPAAPEAPGSATGGLRTLAMIGTAAYLVLALGIWVLDHRSRLPDLAAAPRPTPGADLLPKKLGAWEQAEFTTQHRDQSSFFGENSCVWRYTSARKSAVVSLDYPFPGWHDLTWCYTAKGWHIDGQAVRTDLPAPGGCVEVRMSQSAHRHAYLLFREFDNAGRPFAARPGGMEASLFRHQSTVLRLRSRLGLDAEVPGDPTGAANQVQVVLESYERLTPEDEAAARDLFLAASPLLAGSPSESP